MRQAIPSTEPGQREYLYFPSKKIKRMPEFAELHLPDAAFRGFTGAFWHAEAVAELVSHVERSAGEIQPRARVLAAIRDGFFRAPITVIAESVKEETTLIPDYTLVVEVDGKPSLLFVEVFNAPALVSPLSPQSIGRSVRFKLAKYRAFSKKLGGHPVIAEIARQLGCRFDGFRVLVLASRGDRQKTSLLSWARLDGFCTMLYFASVEELRSSNLFTDPVWSLPSGEKRGLADNTSHLV